MIFSPVHFARRIATLLAIFSIAIANISHAAESDAHPDAVQSQNASLRIGVEGITLPGDENMGMLNVAYLIEIAPNIYLGPSGNGAITGRRGGFFTFGGELAWRHRLGSILSLETGVYLGGGGGSTRMVGGGLMVRPHADLMWDFGSYRAGITASMVRFPNGFISSNQFGVVVDFDNQFRHIGFTHASNQLPTTERTGVGFDRAVFTVGTYKPSKSSTFLHGVPLQRSIGYVGARMERKITPNIWGGIEAIGAGSGGVAGYAEFLGTMGAEMPIMADHLTVGARAALGMGGGGAVSVGGGVLVKASIYATANLNRDFHVSLEGGVADSPNGNFRATYGTLGVHWDLDHPFSAATTSNFIANEWVFGTEHYFKAKRLNNVAQDVNLVTLKFNRYMTDSFYLTGQAHSAYSGFAGGYSVGLVGAGFCTSRCKSKVYVGAEMLAGAGAGGAVDSGGGFLIQPMVYLGAGISKSMSARLSAGRIQSFRGTLNSPVAEMSLSFAFGTTNRN